MSDLIRREDARSDVICLHTYQFHYGKYPDRGEWLMLVDKREVLNAINAIPSADRPRGEWIGYDSMEDKFDDIRCSCCQRLFTVDAYHFTDIGFTKDDLKFCPNCGARMKGADDE